MDSFKLPPALKPTHEVLAGLYPFYCCWLDDGNGEPDEASVMLGPVFFSMVPLGYTEKQWIN